MALFSRKKDASVESKETKSVAKATTKALNTDRNLSQVIVGPRITEKSVKMGESNVYTFTVARSATKFSVRDAIKTLYSVTPVKINIVNKLPAHRMSGSKNRLVKVPGYKKAYVYLKKGDTINLV
ncbi:MAG: 50S ribosomal protein L23 [Candidatus Paceibacterota bacterium]